MDQSVTMATRSTVMCFFKRDLWLSSPTSTQTWEMKGGGGVKGRLVAAHRGARLEVAGLGAASSKLWATTLGSAADAPHGVTGLPPVTMTTRSTVM